MFTLLLLLSLLALLSPLTTSFHLPLRHRSLLPPSVLFSTPSPSDPPYTPEQLTKSLEKMTKFTNQYLKRTKTYLSSDPSVPSLVIKGLAIHKTELGAPLCPCRYYDDKPAAVKEGYWNCPCVPMRETQTCHCKLFLKEDDWVRGDDTSIDFETVMREVEKKENEAAEDVGFGDDDDEGFEIEFE